MNENYEIEYTTKDNVVLTIAFSAEFEVEDRGIGAYEYWGAKCNDVDLVNVCCDIVVGSAINEDGEDIYESLPDSEKKRINEYAEEHANENAPEADGCSDFGDYDEDIPDRID